LSAARSTSDWIQTTQATRDGFLDAKSGSAQIAYQGNVYAAAIV
jgi:hypothetical protein